MAHTVISKVAEIDAIGWRGHKAKVKLVDGREYICKPLYTGDSEKETEEGFSLPEAVVMLDNTLIEGWTDDEIESVEEIE